VKPSRLVAEGFAAFRERIEIDFSDADFFALVGPTGSGKSSIIDAIGFALYGVVPRYADERLTLPAISLGATQARVALEFVAAGRRYRALRMVRIKGASTAQLDRLSDDGETVEILAGNATEMKTKIPTIIGLTYDHFKKCVVLPQGEFDAFLHAKPGDRRDLLVRLLDLGVYDRIAGLARERQVRHEAEVKHHERTLSDLGPIDDVMLHAAAARVDDLAELRDRADVLVTADDALVREIAALTTDAAGAEQAATALGAVCVPEQLAALASRQTEATDRLAASSATLDSAREELRAASLAAASGPTAESLRALLGTHDRIAELIGGIRESETQVSAARAALDDAVRADDTAADEERLALAEREALRHTLAAHDLRAHLTVGEPCPVCEQLVVEMPGSAVPTGLRAADSKCTSAAERHDAARRERARAERAEEAAMTRLDGLQQQLASAESGIGDQPGRDETTADLERVEAIAAAIAAARSAEADAQRVDDEARSTIAQLGAELERHRGDYHHQRDAIAASGVAGVPSPSGQLGRDWTELATWAASEIPARRQRVAELRGAVTACALRRSEETGGLRDSAIAADVEIDPASELAAIREAIGEALFAAKARQERIIEARDTAAKVTEALACARREAEVARTLRQHLGRNFERWLLQRALTDLAILASDRLRALSSGRYTLDLNDDGEFVVADHSNAGQTRPVRSLSGGETFQASLALALALAEQVAALSPLGAGTLESIFLDEGFGTLDLEALDVVADTIELLGAGERMVGIVTHVAALAERIPVRFRLRNDGRTATIERDQ